MSETRIVGIDPGTNGAMAFLTLSGSLENCVDLPGVGTEPLALDVLGLLEAFAPLDRLFVGVEAPFAIASNASSAALSQGIGYGKLLGVLESHEIRYWPIRPADWKERLGVPMAKGMTHRERKQGSFDVATALWGPKEAKRYWPLRKHDGRAEAALIAEYARLTYLDNEGTPE